MIQVKERLYVDVNEFFNQLETSIAYDIEQATGKKIKPYKGYKYKKVMKNKVGRKGEVEVVITELTPPKCYSASFKSINGINKIIFLNNAKKIDFLACPRAINVCWQLF